MIRFSRDTIRRISADGPDMTHLAIFRRRRLELSALAEAMFANLPPGERVLAAVSGGGDSMALWALINPPAALRDRLVIGHVHHGTEPHAGRARDFVLRHGEDLEQRVVVSRIQVLRAREKAIGFEAAAREERYRALERIADRVNASRLLSGHTFDDLAETLLINLSRGAGSAGLAGIRPQRGRWFRPLLCYRRDQLRSFLAGIRWPYLDDPANLDENYTRVRVRNRLLPVFAELFGEGAVENVGRAAVNLQDVDDALDAEAERAYRSALIRSTVRWLSIDASALDRYFDEMVVRILRRALAHARGCPPAEVTLDRKARSRLLSAVRSPASGQRVYMHGVSVLAGRNIVFSGWGEDDACAFAPPGELELGDGSRVIARGQPMDPGARSRVNENDRPGYDERLDADALGARVLFRPWRIGDRFVPLGHETGDVRVTRRLRRAARERTGPLWVMEAEDGRIAWVLGERIAAPFRITGRTRTTWSFRYLPPR
ncbi:MAG: tRNA(Ile)-lysidine synthase [Calditrichaeota bacterium]|nr:tRNA(Ile)-lysidine synthase [Calditrichota bacterium]